MARTMGGPFDWPPIPFPVPDVSADMSDGATFRMTMRPEVTVASARVTHAMIEKGRIDRTTAGM